MQVVADPQTGVAVYDSYGTGGGWQVYGGTSASSPIIASVLAMATPPGAGVYPVQYPYANRARCST
jgi:subtilase family serine protease